MNDLHVYIEYRAIRNKRDPESGWLPMLSINGRDRGDEWARKGLDLETALKYAHEDAYTEANRWGGDYVTHIRQGVSES